MNFFLDKFSSEIDLRISRIRKFMTMEGVDALIIGANANLYYSSGRFFRGFVYIPIDQPPLWFVIKPQFFDTAQNLFYIRKPEEIPSIIKDLGYTSPISLALEEDDLSYSEILRLKALFPNASLYNGSSIMKKARMVKTDLEIEEMKTDGIHHADVYSKIKGCYKPGMSDLRLQIEIEKHLRLEGALGVSRVAGNLMEINMGSVISGDNADNPAPYEFTMGGAGVHPVLPVGADNSEIKEGTTVMIDMNGAFNGYQTDMTRVWARGKISDLAIKAHECSMLILRELEVKALPDIPVKDLFNIAMDIVKSMGLEKYFMGHKSQVGFIGHGVGIQLNELPVLTSKSKDILEKNMTIAIEPKFVIPGVGAVGVENTYVVTDTGLRNLTIFPEEIQYF